METWDAVRSRRNVRSYTGSPVPGEHLEQILEAGRRAPSAQNWQPWDFILVTDPQRLSDLSQVAPGAGHVAGAAAAVALVARAPRDERQAGRLRFDLGQATMAMMLVAADLGIGSGHAGVGDQDRARAILGHPDDRVCAFLIAFGYPADRPLRPINNPDRRQYDEVVHIERW